MIRPQIIYKSPDEDRSLSFIHYFSKRVNESNKNFLCAVTGKTGSGKSWLCGAIAGLYEEISGVKHNPKVHTIFSLEQLLELINHPNLSEILPPGTFLFFDEPQVEVNSRTWQDESNQILATLVSTFRNMRLIIFFATPYLEFIDKQSRVLFHAEIEVQGYDKTTGYTLCKPRLLDWNPKMGKFYYHRLMVMWPNPALSVLDWYYVQNWEVYKPKKEWIEIYEPMKLAFTKKLNRELQQQYIYSKSQVNKGRDLVAIQELFDAHGENYTVFSRELPHLTPYNIERLVAMVKKQKKAEKKVKLQENVGKSP